MDNYIKNIVIRKCDIDSKIKALSDLENDINIAKEIITGKYIYCNDCDDYYLTGSFMEEKEYKVEKILVYSDPINSSGNEYADGRVEYIYKICPKGHKHKINRREIIR